MIEPTSEGALQDAMDKFARSFAEVRIAHLRDMAAKARAAADVLDKAAVNLAASLKEGCRDD